MGDVSIRPAGPDDAAAICSIHNQGLEDRLATLEPRLRTPAERRPGTGAPPGPGRGVSGPPGPPRSAQRPTGGGASAATAMPTVNAPVIATREAARSVSIAARKTGKP